MTNAAPTLDQVPAQAQHVATEVVDGELLLYDSRQTTAVYLSPTAAVIWALCDGRRNAREIVRMVREQYPDSSGDVEAEVLATLSELRQSGVLSVN
jgi:hypothetical protein